MSNSFFDLISQLQKATGNEPRETAMPGTFIGRPVEELEAPIEQEAQLPVDMAPPVEMIPEVQAQTALASEDIAPIAVTAPSNEFSNTVDLAQNPPSEPIQPEPEANPLEKLLSEYRATRQQNSDGIKEGYEADRKAQLIQGLASAAANIVGASGFAGGNVMSGPKDLSFKPIDLGYAKQAKDTGSAKLEGLMADIQLMKAMKQDAPKGQFFDAGDRIIYAMPDGSYKEVSKKGMSEKDRAYINMLAQQGALGQQKLTQQKELFEKGEGRRVDEFEFRKQEKDELSDKQLEGISSFDKVTSTANQIRQLYPEITKKLGPYAARAEDAKAWVPGVEKDPSFVKMQALVADQMSQYIKSLSGLTVSDRERQQLEKVAPKMEDKPGEFMIKLQNFEDTVARLKGVELKALKEYQGKSSKRSLQSEQQPSNTVERLTKDGKTAIFDAETKKFLKYK